jgi:hypothetical protein
MLTKLVKKRKGEIGTKRLKPIRWAQSGHCELRCMNYRFPEPKGKNRMVSIRIESEQSLFVGE